MARCEHHSFESAHRLWCLTAQRTLLGGRYTDDILAIVNGVITPCFLAVKYNRITASLAIADYVHVFKIINLTVLVQWKCVKQYISFSVIARLVDNLDTERIL